jgi:hypothetical protein
MDVNGPVIVRAVDTFDQNTFGRMDHSLVGVPGSSIPRRRTLIKLIDMGNRMRKMSNSDRSPTDACVFCGIIRGVGTRKMYEVIHVSCLKLITLLRISDS